MKKVNNMKLKKGTIIYSILFGWILWIAMTNAVQMFKCPKMTQTELFIHLPKSIVLDFNVCD